MNGYERVKAALELREPDRVPIMEWYIHRKVVRALCPSGRLFDLVEHLDLDGVSVGARGAVDLDNPPEIYVDKWGAKFGRTAESYQPIEGPIKSLADLERYAAPDPYDEDNYATLREAVKRFKGKRFICYTSRSDFFSSVQIRGFVELLTDFVENPRLAHGVLKVVNDYYCTVNRLAAELGADAVVVTGDLAYNSGPFMSPKHYREFVLPYFTRSVRTIKQAGAFVVKHSDGNLWPIMEMLADAGIHGINPIQPDAGMDLGEMKQKYGRRLCLIGNVNCGHTLSEAPVPEVVREVKEAIGKGGPGGGYIMMSSNSIHSSVQPENYRAMVEATRKYGKYPLDMAALS